jgi:hypothetical protein
VEVRYPRTSDGQQHGSRNAAQRISSPQDVEQLLLRIGSARDQIE